MCPARIPVREAMVDPVKKFMKDNLNAKQYAELCGFYDTLPASRKELLQRSLPEFMGSALSKQRVARGFQVAVLVSLFLAITGAAIFSVNALASTGAAIFSTNAIASNGELFNSAGEAGLILFSSGFLALVAACSLGAIYDRQYANDMYALLSNMISRQPLNPQEERPGQQVHNVLYLVSNGRNIVTQSLAVNHSTSQAEQHGSPCALATIVEEDAEPQATVNDVDAESAVEQSVAPSTIDIRF